MWSQDLGLKAKHRQAGMLGWSVVLINLWLPRNYTYILISLAFKKYLWNTCCQIPRSAVAVRIWSGPFQEEWKGVEGASVGGLGKTRSSRCGPSRLESHVGNQVIKNPSHHERIASLSTHGAQSSLWTRRCPESTSISTSISSWPPRAESAIFLMPRSVWVLMGDAPRMEHERKTGD